VPNVSPLASLHRHFEGKLRFSRKRVSMMLRSEVFVLLAPGFEEADVSTVTRTLRQSGLPVAVVGLTAGPIRGNYGLSLAPDMPFSEVEAASPKAVVLPGGVQGAKRLNAEPRVHALLRQVVSRGGYVVALDAAYTVLRSAGLLDKAGKWPAEMPVIRWCGEGPLSGRVVVEGPVVFGRDSGAAQESALTLLALLEGRR